MQITRRTVIKGSALCAGEVKLIPLLGGNYINTRVINKGVI